MIYLFVLTDIIVGCVCFACGWYAHKYSPANRILEMQRQLESQQRPSNVLPISPYTGQEYDPECGVKRPPTS